VIRVTTRGLATAALLACAFGHGAAAQDVPAGDRWPSFRGGAGGHTRAG